MESNSERDTATSVGEGRTPVPLRGFETALDIIRTDTVLSKLPVHNLAKKGRVDIQIKKLGPNGEMELQWEVSYSERYGQARQLAYKIDTLVVDESIDKTGRPLPQRICLGSLNQIAAELGLVTDQGPTNKNIKRALRQNALTGITAKFRYLGNDGIERTLEATFTRYSVIFTGEKFSDGSRADAVYIELNPTYREVLNNAPVRPLDLAYKKILPPAAQRFYEIVSYKVFAALKYKHPVAKLAYSEYCTFSAQQRYFDYNHFKKQMYKVHRPHLQSGYISQVRFEQTKDDEGRPDWIMCYIPGPKAETEFAAAHRGHKFTSVNIPSTSAIGEQALRRAVPRQRRLKLEPMRQTIQVTMPKAVVEPQEKVPSSVPVDPELLSALTSRGITETAARDLITHLKPNQDVLDQLEWGEHQFQTNPSKFTNPAGFYIHLIQENVNVPAIFESSRKRAARLEEEERRRWEQTERERLERRYEEYRDTEIDRYFTANPNTVEFTAIKEVRIKELRQQYKNLTRELIRSLAESDARRQLAKNVPMLSFDEFAHTEKALEVLNLSNENNTDIATLSHSLLQQRDPAVPDESGNDSAVVEISTLSEIDKTQALEQPVKLKTTSEQQIDPENNQAS